MPHPLSPNKYHAIKAMLLLSMDTDVIASKAKCGACTVHHIRANLATFGTVRRPAMVKRGLRSRLTPEMKQVLSSYWYMSRMAFYRIVALHCRTNYRTASSYRIIVPHRRTASLYCIVVLHCSTNHRTTSLYHTVVPHRHIVSSTASSHRIIASHCRTVLSYYIIASHCISPPYIKLDE
jgi:hypothetical protein